MPRLLVILNDRLSALVRKGEITDRYYNPGNLFDEVDFLLLNDDKPDLQMMQRTVGNARIAIHHHPGGQKLFVQSLGWNFRLLTPWVKRAVALVKKINPQLIRSHGIFENGYIAACIHNELNIPLVVSLHTHPDADLRRTSSWIWDFPGRIILEFLKKFERATLRNADRVIIVYESQREYVRKNGAQDVRLIYNLINPANIRPKLSYHLHSPIRLLYVGRLFKEKNPENIIRALKGLPVTLTIIGDGAFYDRIQKLVMEQNLQNQVQSIRSMANDEICRSLADYDLFVVHNEYYGIPKAILEPLLTGLPVIVNKRHPEPVPELSGDWVHVVENTPEHYRNAIQELITDHTRRRAIGQNGYRYAWKLFSPEIVEQQLVKLYHELIPEMNDARSTIAPSTINAELLNE
jgi:glycosyltransferase involved in cell wall biosynthesis